MFGERYIEKPGLPPPLRQPKNRKIYHILVLSRNPLGAELAIISQRKTEPVDHDANTQQGINEAASIFTTPRNHMKGGVPSIIHGEGLEGTQRPQVEAEREGEKRGQTFF